jgi:hypothetical protein
MKKKAALAAVLIVMVVCTVAFVAYADTPFVLHPTGRIRVALRSYGGGSATWYPTEPRVYDGSFSARLNTGTSSDTDGGAIFIGPLSLPLAYFTDARITFWAYHLNDAGAHPYINIVLDNGRTMEGIGSTPVVAGATVNCESGNLYGSVCKGYPAADWWIQMKPSGGWYTSWASSGDPVLAPVAACTSGSPCTMAFWQSKFPTAKVIQIQIIYGLWTNTGQTIYIDDVTIPAAPPFGLTTSMTVPIEPETIPAADV